MSISRIVLYYTFTPLSDPEAVRLWQHTLCRELGLKGRLIVSPHGLNGTVGGELSAVKQYVKQTRTYGPFRDMEFKWSDGGAEDFPRLSVKVRPELVAFGVPDEVQVDESGVIGGGQHLTPHEVHELVEARRAEGVEVAFFDGRNAVEARIGRFKDAVVPETETTRDFVAELDSGKYDHLKDQPVVTYCTGGIRCEVLSSLMRNRGFEEVYQLDGGIVRYGETYGDSGLWEGELYVFDGRMNTRFSQDSVTVGECTRCAAPTSTFHNCLDRGCSTLQLYCEDCRHIPETTRCAACEDRLSRPSQLPAPVPLERS
ncbi:rhodanese-related sulfurtransferase [Nesterenkonia sp. HG001]|uniref:oxygen-dependent tRNA uridine(34) hydroxylase TrhO n=1 Tax=Nesterenkonia sp. HG001 TaxID=2983207 RepID=UPI002AC5796B|nr:rhodanese-related sulfurtransferase [Nesterenkonia sp. HG001]MDZ5077044.1 rhodanese-related sulfurtransferase [Nesterenkonia sp. HG001]